MAALLLILVLVNLYTAASASFNSGQVQVQTSTSEQYCSFFANRAPARQPTLKNCTWYKENSCCLQREIDATFNKVKPLQGASRECQRYMNFLMCYICAPNQNLFYSGGELTVCNDFCDKFHEACSSAILKGYIISELYASGYDFCQSRQYRVGSNSDIRCFRYSTLADKSSASNVKISSPSLMLVLLSSYFLTSNPSSSLRPVSLLSVVAVLSLFGAVFADKKIDEVVEKIAKDLTSVAKEGLQFESIQAVYDDADYVRVTMNGTERVAAVRKKLASFFAEKAALASDLSLELANAYDIHSSSGLNSTPAADEPVLSLKDLPADVFMDGDFMWEQSWNLTQDVRFPHMKVHDRISSVKIADQVDRSDPAIARTVQWTSSVERTMRRNFHANRDIRWQYFGSSKGVYRQFPGSASPLNFVGFPLDYDARVRPWYLSATSGAKDVVLILDGSLAMEDRNGLAIMKDVASTLVETFSVKDSVAVLVSRSTYWTTRGEEKQHMVENLGCHAQKLVPMTTYLRTRLLWQIDKLEAKGGADHR